MLGAYQGQSLGNVTRCCKAHSGYESVHSTLSLLLQCETGHFLDLGLCMQEQRGDRCEFNDLDKGTGGALRFWGVTSSSSPLLESVCDFLGYLWQVGD